jgi:fumarate reductase subunit C
MGPGDKRRDDTLMNVRLYILQRATAVLMVPLIIVHVVVSFAWAAYYSLFVVAAAIHAGIGVRTVAIEWGGLRTRGADAVMWGIGLALFVLGMRAVIAVVLP